MNTQQNIHRYLPTRGQTGLRRVARALLVLLPMLFTGGCAIFPSAAEEEEERTVEEMYAIAKDNMDNNNWLTAIAALEKLEGTYPYGAHAEQAKLDIAYAHYRNNQRGLSVAASERFIKEHPSHPFVDYAYYLKGLAHYQQDESTFGRLLGRDDLSDRDAEITRAALNAFTEVYELFPESRYAPEARVRARKLTEALARHEIIVAAYYFGRNANVAVVNRAKGVVEDYAHTAAVEEALALLVYSYEAMELASLAESSRRVLRRNFPESAYLGKDGFTALRAALKEIAPFAQQDTDATPKRPSFLRRLLP